MKPLALNTPGAATKWLDEYLGTMWPWNPGFPEYLTNWRNRWENYTVRANAAHVPDPYATDEAACLILGSEWLAQYRRYDF